jgi:hypothetical protein
MEENDFEDQESPEPEEEPTEASPAPEGEAKLKKLQQENVSLRRRLRRTELVTKHGQEIVDLIPDELPVTKWDQFAEKLSTRLAERAQEAPAGEAEQPAPEEEPTESEKKMAVLNKPTTASPVAKTWTGPELEAAYRRGEVSAEEFTKLIAEGKLVKEQPPGVVYHTSL